MYWNGLFVMNSILLGAGLAMDAFSVSLANGLSEPRMRRRKMCGIAGIFAFFQFAMPMIGWVCLHTILEYFQEFERYIPWIALVLLSCIGGKMLLEGFRNEAESEACENGVGVGTLLLQGIATSIDALSVGFTIADYDLSMALACSLLVAAATFVICLGGVCLGKKIGTKLSKGAALLGGCILIIIGWELFLGGLFG